MAFLLSSLSSSSSSSSFACRLVATALFFVVMVHGWAPTRQRTSSCSLLRSTPERPDSVRTQGIQPLIQAGSRALAAGLLGSGALLQVRKVVAAAADVVLPPLPYAYDALAPHISAKTLMYHHDKHHAKYVETTIKMVQGTDLEGADLVTIMKQTHTSKPALFNNAAQAWNHAFYWECMKPNGGGKPSGKLAQLIDKQFGSYEKFRESFAAAGNTVFGSGWAWLVQTKAGALEVVKTGGAENPILEGKTPLLTMDVWEHAYYLDYQNARGAYVDAFLDNLVNWDFVESNLGKKA